MIILFISHTIHVWYIYLHLIDFYGKCRQIMANMPFLKLDTCPTLATNCLTLSLRVTSIICTYFKLELNVDLKAMD